MKAWTVLLAFILAGVCLGAEKGLHQHSRKRKVLATEMMSTGELEGGSSYAGVRGAAAWALGRWSGSPPCLEGSA